MALTSFRIAAKKSLVLAELDQVGPLMVIAGPNGVGKSTLLYALKRREGATFDRDTKILYQPPHRAIRRQPVRRRWIASQGSGYSDFIAADEVSGVEGLNIQFPQRGPDNVDESGSTLKYTFGRLENKRQSAITALVDRSKAKGRLSIAKVPSVYEPLERLMSALLPHLSFQGVSFSNEDDIGLMFGVASSPDSAVDLNDLSSGEKAILLLFMPLIEEQISDFVDQLAADASEPRTTIDRLLLIDEPEEHLHPELQARVLAYFREETLRPGLQAILMTHSPTMLDLATDTELFVLGRPLGDQNQLTRVATSAARLGALKDLVGNPYVVTTGRTVVLLEGTPDRDSSIDARALDRIHPAATRYTFIQMGGRRAVESTVRGLRTQVSEKQFGISILGLVDADRGPSAEPGVVSWPFASLENLLIKDSDAIDRVIARIGGDAIGSQAIDNHLNEVALSMADDEIRIRVSDALKPRTYRFGGASLPVLTGAFENVIVGLQAEVADTAELARVLDRTRASVTSELTSDAWRSQFRGKLLLHGLLRRLALHNVGYTAFAAALAEECRGSSLVQDVLDAVFAELDAARVARLT